MKKFLVIPAVALTALALSGCASLLASIATTPSFVVPDNDVYNGQTVRITKTGTCNYKWETSDATHLPLVEKDGTAYITGHLDKNQYGNYESSRVAVVKASNKDDDTVKPEEHEVSIYSWHLAVYDAADKRIEDPLKLARNTEYTVKMVRIGGASGNPTYIPVTKLYRSLRIGGEELESLTFTLSSTALTKVGQTELAYTFKTPNKAVTSPVTINAKLGDVTMSLRMAVK